MPRLTQTGRLQHSALLGSATPCRNRSFAAIRRSRQGRRLTESGRLLQSAVLDDATLYTNWSLAANDRGREVPGLTHIGRMLHSTVLGRARLTGTGRLLQSTVLDSTTPCRNRPFAAICRSRQSPRLTQIGHLQQTATASPGSASPLSRSQFPRNMSKYIFNGQALAHFPRNLWIAARRPLSALTVCAELRFLPRGFAQTRSSFRISAAKTAKSAALLQTVRTEAQFATNRNTGVGRGEGNRRSPRPAPTRWQAPSARGVAEGRRGARPAPTRWQTPSTEANLKIVKFQNVRFLLIRLPHH